MGYLDELYQNYVVDMKELLQKDAYLSKKDYQKLIDQYSYLFLHALDLDDSDFRKRTIIKVSNELEQIILTHNQKFLEHKLIEYREYFDHLFDEIDSSIQLDDEQRKAILMDEDYSLVIAGAGSGKTTTMTAKVKYLIEKCHIDPKEIVVLSFTKKAVDELNERMNQEFKLDVAVKTFHQLGLAILNDRLGIKVSAIELGEQRKIINQYIQEIIFPNKQKLKKIMSAFSKDIFLDPSCLEYSNFEDYWNHYTMQTYEQEKNHLKEWNDSEIQKRLEGKRSIQNEYLKSKPEVLIANYLFRNGICYSYEQRYKESEHYISYNPDFTIYLPQGKKIYIEFYGLIKYEEKGHYSKEEILEYRYLIQKKKLLHQKYGTDLIELYPSNDYTRTDYLDFLKKELEKREIFSDKKNEKEIFLKIMETKKESQIFKFTDLVLSFISKFKSKNYTDEDFFTLKNKIDNKPEVIEQLTIIREIYHYYNRKIHKEYLVDFEDMVNYAYRYMDSHPLTEEKLNYRYIIVDEYQDISFQRFHLLQKISQIFNAKIIGVGDDWQAVFGFSGADIQLFTKFCELMGYGEIIKITNTYRNSQELIDIAGEFVLKNTNQFEKKLKSIKHLPNPIEIIYYDRNQKSAVGELLIRILDQIYLNNPKHDVLLLGRYHKDKEKILENSCFKEGIESEQEIIYQNHKDMKIKFLTVHSAKGLGFDQVILLNAIDDTYGFPSKKKEQEILSILNDESEDDIEFAEERRLFYVAITRTKNKVYILAPNTKTSIFVDEIKDNKNVLENRELIDDLEII